MENINDTSNDNAHLHPFDACIEQISLLDAVDRLAAVGGQLRLTERLRQGLQGTTLAIKFKQ